ncbi:sigma-70 family RNA polymerase sigma factor [Paraburkholderia acidiphila]|uniref:Sigma-70 family RNA polymerase sigma factor n=1 Tax=Paraburkholderia acidiphila TaxID=2571747 RepID=A0A7Z2G5J6_9BURK|nr:sigma-70 family RNA polymerase sigma factor [Paraburkholderia acidiphila]QGZ55427.1 sigma-70 family RNA polymerase sigma factor [Paraburkholderia acidiphila]
MTQAIDTIEGTSLEGAGRNEAATPASEAGPREETWTDARRAAAFDEARGRLIALATRVLGSRAEAEDVVQDAWFRWRDADAPALRAPQAWLATVTVRLAIDRLRRLRRENAGEQEAAWLDDAAPSAEEAGLRARRFSDALLLLLERLGPLEQAVFVLREAFDCDYAQIGALTGCTNEHCRQIVRRARVRLAREAAPQAAPADKVQHARTAERLRDVLHAQDRVGLMDLLGVTATALVTSSVAEAAEVVAQRHGTQEATAGRVLRAEALALDGEPGVALVAQDGALAAWLHVRDDRDGLPEPVVCVAAMEEGSTLQAANQAFGGDAVRKLLARLASSDGAACVSTLRITAQASTAHGCTTMLAQPLVVA